MDICVKHISIRNFRAIKSFDSILEERNLFIGCCNHGKTAIVEAICLALGCTDWIDTETESNFFYDKQLLVGDPRSQDFTIVLTFTLPKHHEAFDDYDAYPFWWDADEKCTALKKTKDEQEAAYKVAFVGLRLSDGTVICKRYFLGLDETLSASSIQASVASDFFQPMRVVYFPLLCLEWLEEFEVTKKKVLEEASKWWDEQEQSLKQVSDAVMGMQQFVQQTQGMPSLATLSDEDQKKILSETQTHVDKMREAMRLLDLANDGSDQKIMIELTKALPWFGVLNDKDQESLEALKNPSFSDLLQFLVKRSMASGAGYSFTPMVEKLLDAKEKGEKCLILFDELEHFIPSSVVVPFMVELLKVARQCVFVSHDMYLISLFSHHEVKEIENKKGMMQLEPIDLQTVPF